MSGIIKTPHFLLQLLKHPLLNISWPISVHLEEEDDISILSDADARVHTIHADQRRLNQPEVYKPAWVHELCHAILAEKIDVQFASLRLSRVHLNNDRLQQSEISMFLDCWQLVDIWVDDLMVLVDPNLKVSDLQLFVNALDNLFRRCDINTLTQYRTLMGIACALAECERHRLNPEPFLYFASLYPPQSKSRSVIREMRELYRSLGCLSFEKTRDLQILEVAVQEAIEIVGFNRWPRLIQEEEKYVWLLKKQ